MGFGALGGIAFLVGLGFALVGHWHMGEGPSDNFWTPPVYPIETFIFGLVLMGIGVIVMICSLVNGVDGALIDYSDFFPESSK